MDIFKKEKLEELREIRKRLYRRADDIDGQLEKYEEEWLSSLIISVGLLETLYADYDDIVDEEEYLKEKVKLIGKRKSRVDEKIKYLVEELW